MSPCARWMALSDREAVGDEISAEDAAFARDHAATCASCRAEAEVWGELGALVDSPPAAAPLGEQTPAKQVRPSRRRVVTAAAIAACAAAAAFWLFAHRGSDRLPVVTPAAVATTPAPAGASVVLALMSGGVAEVDGRAGSVGQTLTRGSVLFAREGAACVVIEPAVRACLERGSLVRVADIGAQRRLELLGGKIAAELDPQPPGTSFGITTRDGVAIAVGTAFSVEVPPGDAPVVTRVLHGTVVVRSSAGAEQRVGAHEVTSMRDARPAALSGVDEDRERTLVVMTPSARTEQPVPVTIDSDALGTEVSVDERKVGTTPLTLLLPAGEHALTLEAPLHAPVRTSMHIVAGAPSVRRFGLPLLALAPKGVPAPVASDAATAGPAQLLVAARERRARGDLEGASAAYRELLDRHGGSAEAHAALVPFGELQLGGLANAQGALQSFDRYLARGGPLEEEASFGRIRALRALGRSAAERAALESFLERFPHGLLTSTVRERLRSLESR
jgi:ferric-dicitrate binding protein FerR (iron transport regulator)